MIAQEPVQAAIWHCLHHYNLKDAVFLAERLCSEVETEDTIFLLATSYYRSSMLHQAYWLLKEKSCRSPQCRFLLAKCSFQLKKFSEAESCLLSTTIGESCDFDNVAKEFGDIACFVLELIAQICVKTERDKIAANAFRKALTLNPFMWNAFACLCRLGEDVNTAETFRITSTDIFNTCQGYSHANPVVFLGFGTEPMDLNYSSSAQTLSSGKLGSSSYDNNCILSTPANTQQTYSHTNNNFMQNQITPNNNCNLNSSVSIWKGYPVNMCNQENMSLMFSDDSLIGSHRLIDEEAHTETNITPFRNKFKYLSTFSLNSPSFGILPLNSPSSLDGSFLGSINSNQNLPSPQTLAEVNQEQKNVCKKVKTHNSTSASRKETSVANNAVLNKPVFTQTGNITPRTPNIPVGVTASLPPAAVRRSTRLFSNNAYSVKENNKSGNITTNSKFVQPRSPARKTKSRVTKVAFSNELIEDKSSANTEKFVSEATLKKEKVETVTSVHIVEEQRVIQNNSVNDAQTMLNHVLSLKKQSADGLMALLQDLGEGYKFLTKFQSREAIQHLENSIPQHHLKSSWVQSIIGLAHYELREYEEAVLIFKRVHENEPYRLEHMEIYSSSLWQLQKEVDLSALAQDFMVLDKTSPITWCIAGNCFSLHKEHETAIKFFKRAVQVDPDFVYSYTLLGHELVLTEELEKALDYFRTAVIKDLRHYNAWFGLGTIYSKQEKYELAELHYTKALKINPNNSVIMVHIGAMQFCMQKKELALQTLNTAAKLDPKNPLARFHRGSIYFSLGKHQEALQELEDLKEIVPKESVVFYLIGKIHKKLGNVDAALMYFSWATDLDPKGANNQIKDAFDSMGPTGCCSALNDTSIDVDLDPVSEHSDDSTQAQDINYDSDV